MWGLRGEMQEVKGQEGTTYGAKIFLQVYHKECGNKWIRTGHGYGACGWLIVKV